MIAAQEKYTSVREVLAFVWLNMVKIQTNDLYRFLLICPNKKFSQNTMSRA